MVTKQAKNRLKNALVEENKGTSNTRTAVIVRKGTVQLLAVYRPVSFENQLIPGLLPWYIHTYPGKNEVEEGSIHEGQTCWKTKEII